MNKSLDNKDETAYRSANEKKSTEKHKRETRYGKNAQIKRTRE
jgi:hypothetical protein